MEGYEIGAVQRVMEERGLDTPGIPFTLTGQPYTCRNCSGFVSLWREPDQRAHTFDLLVFQNAKHDVCPVAA